LDTIIALKAELDIRIQRDLRNNIDLIKRFPYITFITEDLDQSQGPSNYYEITRTQILNGDVESLMMEGANILFIENSVYNQIESLIPSKFAIVNRNSWKTMQLFYRWAYFITHKNQKNDSQNPESSIDEKKLRKIEDRIERVNQDFQQKDWASEISWRLIRLYELRNMKVINRPYEKDLKFLLPRSIDLSRFLVNAWGIALPSILESIQKGTAEQFRGNIETIMKKGFPDTLFEPRHKKMTYQFRMHEQISEYPRLAFYNEEALINSKKILPVEKGGKGEREWKYKRYTKTGYKSRFTWINVESQISGRGRNINEVSALMRELRIFINWAIKNPREDEQNWSVACLTYYRGQEKLIRKRLQELTNQSRKFANFNYENVDIVLHTVDKIQGSEADIVFLSMVRTCSRKIYSEHQGGNIGFMDNPNRLNVGLTRAKYQLVILGQLKNFEDQDISPHLKDLTQAVTVENENELEEHKDRQNWRENAKKRKDNSPNQNNRNWIDETSHRINAKADRERNNRKYNHSQGSNHSKPYKPNNPNNRNFKPDSYKRREQK
jgi:hypothetical protein